MPSSRPISSLLAPRAIARTTEHETMQMDVQFGGAAEALDQRVRAAVGLAGPESRLEQMPRELQVHDLQHRREQLRLCREQQAQRNRPRPHPLAYRKVRDDVVDQVGSGVRHAPARCTTDFNPRRLQLNATSLSCPQSAQHSPRKP